MQVRTRLLAVVAVLATVASCGGPFEAGGDNDTLTVFAASSLTSAFEDLGARFERDHPGIRLEFNFGSSSDLATQLEQGARAEVFASADEANMLRVEEAGLITGEPRVFAHNKLEIIVPPDNPGGVTGLDDLENDDLVFAICNEDCPAGRYALQIFDNAGISVEADSFEAEVKAVVTRVALGEADAGIVYATDTRAASGDVKGITIPDDANLLAQYPIAPLEESTSAADQWIEFVLAVDGRSLLREQGFLVP